MQHAPLATMTVPAEIIILSSSPDPPQRTPKKAVCRIETCSAISPLAATSPSLLRLPSRSRFFPTPSALNDATKKERGESKAASANVIDKDGSSKSQENAKKAKKGPNSDVLADLESGSLGTRKNVVTKPARSQKGRSQSSVKTKEQGNMTLAGKVTKPSNVPKKSEAKRAKKAPDARKSSSENQQTESRKPTTLEKDGDLHLDAAMRRRIDWTPPRETNSKGVPAGGGDGDIADGSDKSSGNALGTILSDYNYSGSGSVARDIANAPGEGPTKRRRIEV